MVWSGEQLELVFSFEPAAILNRVRVELDSYQGLALAGLASTPDGVVEEDLRATLLPENLSLDGSSNKFSGDFVIDFDPRHVRKLRVILTEIYLVRKSLVSVPCQESCRLSEICLYYARPKTAL